MVPKTLRGLQAPSACRTSSTAGRCCRCLTELWSLEWRASLGGPDACTRYLFKQLVKEAVTGLRP